MRGYISKIRPAGSAIVAVLALSSTYGYAQEAAVSDVAPPLAVLPPASVPIIAAPVPPSAGSTDAAAAKPMVQPTAPVEARISAARAAAEQEAAEQNAKAATALQTAPVARVDRPVGAKAPTFASPVERTPDPVPQPVAPIASSVAAVPDQTTAAPEVATRTGDSAAPNDWARPATLGGGALLLLGLGAVAVSRRRRGAGTALDDHQPIAAPAMPITPAPVPAAKLAPTGVHGNLAAMVAAPPSAENPFLTPRKRMMRARFLLAQQEKFADGQKAAINEGVPPRTVRAEPQMQTVYRMGADRKRGMTFEPQTR